MKSVDIVKNSVCHKVINLTPQMNETLFNFPRK